MLWLRAEQHNDDPQAIGLQDDIVPREHFGTLVALDDACATVRDTRAAILDEAQAKAGHIVAAARAEAEGLTERARQMFESAADRGREDGRVQGLAQWWEQTAVALNTRWLARMSAREHIVALVAEAVERMVRAASPADLFARASETVERIIVEGCQLNVHVHSDDYEVARAQFGALADSWAAQGRPIALSVQASSELPPGSCICDTDVGTLDASLHVQLQAVRQAMTRAVQDAVPAHGSSVPAAAGDAGT